MALPQLSSSDAGASARDKINLAIAEADKVGGIAAILAALQVQLAPYIDLVGSAEDRPGDAKTLFTRQMTGAPKSRPALDRGTIADGGELGQVLRISGADADPVSGYIDIAPRRAYYAKPGRSYLLQADFARFQDPSDPVQNAIEFRLQNLSGTFGQVSDVRLGDAYPATVQDGSYFLNIFIGKARSPGLLSYTIPPTSRYMVPHLRIYGNGQQTDVGAIRLYDVTDALSGGADISAIIARLVRLESGQNYGVIYAADWNDLKTRTGRIAGAAAESPDTDVGTHTDPVTGLTVPNAGKFSYSLDPAGWRWVSITNAKQAALDLARSVARYWSRPGEGITAWTSDISVKPSAAAPLSAAGAFSLPDAVAGKALRITGNGSAGPIAWTRIENDGVLEFRFTISSGFDDPVVANRVPLMRLRTFDDAGVDLGNTFFTATALLVADGVKTFVYRVSRLVVPGTIKLPANARYLRPFVNNVGTTGAIDVYVVEPKDVTGQVASGDISSVTADVAKTYEVLLKNPSDGKFASITHAEFYKIIQGEDVDSNLTPNDLVVSVGEASTKLIGDDLFRRSVVIQAPNADIAIAFGGGKASFDGSTHSYIIFAGSKETYKGMKTGVISMIARAPIAGNLGGVAPTFPAKVSVTLGRTVTTPFVNPPLGDYDALSYWPDSADSRLITQWRSTLDKFASEGLLPKLSLIWFGAGATEENNRINLANPSGPKLTYVKGTTGIITTPYKNTKGGGTDAYINSNLNSAALKHTASSQFLATQIDGTSTDSVGYTTGVSSNYYIQANRTATSSRVRNSPTGDDVLTGAAGSFIAYNRNNADNYAGYVEDEKTVFPISNAAVGTRNLMILGVGSTNTAGVAAITTQPVRYVIAGEGLNSDLSVKLVRTEMAAIMAVCAAIRGGA